MVSLEFFIDILVAALWPWVRLSLGLNLLEPSGPFQACNGIALPLTVIRLNSHAE